MNGDLTARAYLFGRVPGCNTAGLFREPVSNVNGIEHAAGIWRAARQVVKKSTAP